MCTTTCAPGTIRRSGGVNSRDRARSSAKAGADRRHAHALRAQRDHVSSIRGHSSQLSFKTARLVRRLSLTTKSSAPLT
jgi:hypothetical protein